MNIFYLLLIPISNLILYYHFTKRIEKIRAGCKLMKTNISLLEEGDEYLKKILREHADGYRKLIKKVKDKK